MSAVARLRRLERELASVRRIGGWGCLARYAAGIGASLPEILRSKSLAPADRTMRGRSWRFSAEGVELELDGDLFSGAREMYGRRVYFALPGFRIAAGDRVVDLGANRGLFSVLAARLGATALAIEAQSGFLPHIRDNARRNGCEERVIVELALVGDGGVLGDDAGLRAASHFGRMPPRVGMAELLARHGFERVDFLKIDIEGAEFGLFAGSPEWLARVDKIAMEVHGTAGDPDDLAAALAARGFAVTQLDDDLAVVPRLARAGGYLFAARLAQRK